jgi:hypothetical protein
MTEQLTRIEHHTVNPDAYDVPQELSGLTRYRMTRKALQFHLEMAGNNVARITAAKGEMKNIAANFPDGLIRFEVHFIEKA